MQPQIPEGLIILIVVTDIHPLRLDTSCNEHLCPLTKWRRHDVKPPIQSVTARRTLKHNSGRQVFLSPGANQHHLYISIVIISWSLTCFNISSSMTETSIPYLSFFFSLPILFDSGSGHSFPLGLHKCIESHLYRLFPYKASGMRVAFCAQREILRRHKDL